MKIKWTIVIGMVAAAVFYFAISAHAATAFIKLPYPKGLSFVVVQGYNTLPTHIKKDAYALDFSQNGCQAYGQPVAAAAAGTATMVNENGYNGGYGTELMIDHGNNLVSRYAHMMPGTIPLGLHATIRQGQVIGNIGDTGLVAGLACPGHPGTHLHFAMDIRNSDGSLTAYDPEPISGYMNMTAGKWYLSDNDEAAALTSMVFSPSVASATISTIATTSVSVAPSVVASSIAPSVAIMPIIITPSSSVPSAPSGGVSASQPPLLSPPTPTLPQTSSTEAIGDPIVIVSSTPSSLAISSSSIIFQQLDHSANSAQSWYDDNWYNLGNGFSGTLNSLTLEGRVSNQDYFASHVALQEFKDPNYTAMVQQFVISDNAPFTYTMATTTFSDLDIPLRPYFYYRLATIQDYQNRSVILAGTSATGTMMWDNFVYGTGRVEYTGSFMPFMVMTGVTATSTLTPPALTMPTNLVTSFNPTALQLGLSWSTSTDPDWAANPLHYDVNYSTSNAFVDDEWGATLPLQLAPGNSYLLGVRAADDFGDVSAIATTTWNFPEGFVAYTLSPGFSYANQEFILSTTTVLDSIKIFTTNFGTGARNPDAASCSLALFYEYATSSYQMIPADNGYSGYGCAGDLTFSFASSSPVIQANQPYQWIFQAQTGNPSTQASVQFYGTASDTAGGPFSDPSLVNARFEINSSSGPVFAN
jgi:murein DD-endopeptidase MepM/ murein hydrolase activator NlpD